MYLCIVFVYMYGVCIFVLRMFVLCMHVMCECFCGGGVCCSLGCFSSLRWLGTAFEHACLGIGSLRAEELVGWAGNPRSLGLEGEKNAWPARPDGCF